MCYNLSVGFGLFPSSISSFLVFLPCLAAWHRRICEGREKSNLFYDVSLQVLIKSESGYL